jgi:hypothetical protein
MNAEKHIEICKKIINKPRGILSKLPSVNRLKQLSIRTDSSGNLHRPSSVKTREDKSSQLLSFAEAESSPSPFKTPLLREELTVKIKREKSVLCGVCNKKVLRNVINKHIVQCGKFDLRPSATEKHLDAKRNYSRLGSQLNQIRSNSTYRLTESQCTSCGASIPKQANFCMMCGMSKCK